MNPSEIAIEQAIDSLVQRPGVFQRLIEDFVEIEFPDLFSSVTPRGRNARDVAIKGWPDVVEGGSGAEATLAKRWRRHLRQDLARVADSGAFRAFVFVAWAGAPSDAERDTLTQEIALALQIEPSNVKLVFRQQLRRSIARPRFARHWHEIFGLPTSSAPFILITRDEETGDPANRLFGADGSQRTFLPSRREYLEGKVHRASIFSEVMDELDTEGFAFVVGQGAAGKTVLALNVSFDERYVARPAYYIDLVENSSGVGTSASDVFNAISTRADEKVLFIIDNVHANEALAAQVLFHWKRTKAGSHLFMLGRKPSAQVDPFGRLPPLRGLAQIPLRASEADLSGIYFRIMDRAGASVAPPAALQAEWLTLFRGDLVAFSAAVHSKRKSLMARQWSLGAEDAAEYVKAAYLSRLSSAERTNLIRLSAVAVLERSLPAACTVGEEFATSMGRGVVHKGYNDSGEFWHYSLVHSGVGRLILAATDSIPNLDAIYKDIAAGSASMGFALARILESRDAGNLTQGIYEELWHQGAWPHSSRSLDDLFKEAKLLEDSGVADRKRIVEAVVNKSDLIPSIAARTYVEQISKALYKAKTYYPMIFDLLIDALSRKEVINGIIEREESALPHHITGVLIIYEREPKLTHLYRDLFKRVFAPGFTKRLSQSIGRASLPVIVGLMKYLLDRDKKAAAELLTFLASGDETEGLAGKMYDGVLEGNIALMREEMLAAVALPKIKLETWTERQAVVPISTSESLTGFARVARQLGSPELIKGPCLSAIRFPSRKLWARKAASFEQVYLVLQEGAGEEFSTVRSFVEVAVVESGLISRLRWFEVYWILERLVSTIGADPRDEFSSSDFVNEIEWQIQGDPIAKGPDALYLFALDGALLWMRRESALATRDVASYQTPPVALSDGLVNNSDKASVLALSFVCKSLKHWHRRPGIGPVIRPENALKLLSSLTAPRPLPIVFEELRQEAIGWLERVASIEG